MPAKSEYDRLHGLTATAAAAKVANRAHRAAARAVEASRRSPSPSRRGIFSHRRRSYDSGFDFAAAGPPRRLQRGSEEGENFLSGRMNRPGGVPAVAAAKVGTDSSRAVAEAAVHRNGSTSVESSCRSSDEGAKLERLPSAVRVAHAPGAGSRRTSSSSGVARAAEGRTDGCAAAAGGQLHAERSSASLPSLTSDDGCSNNNSIGAVGGSDVAGAARDAAPDASAVALASAPAAGASRQTTFVKPPPLLLGGSCGFGGRALAVAAAIDALATARSRLRESSTVWPMYASPLASPVGSAGSEAMPRLPPVLPPRARGFEASPSPDATPPTPELFSSPKPTHAASAAGSGGPKQGIPAAALTASIPSAPHPPRSHPPGAAALPASRCSHSSPLVPLLPYTAAAGGGAPGDRDESMFDRTDVDGDGSEVEDIRRSLSATGLVRCGSLEPLEPGFGGEGIIQGPSAGGDRLSEWVVQRLRASVHPTFRAGMGGGVGGKATRPSGATGGRSLGRGPGGGGEDCALGLRALLATRGDGSSSWYARPARW